MTRRILALLIAIMVPGAAMAFSVGTETIDNYGIDAAGFNYISHVEFDDGFISWLNVETWGHTLSSDYMDVPNDFTINQATLSIEGWRYAGFGGEVVQVGGTLQWSGTQGWQLVSYTDNVFDISGIDHTFWNSSPLYVSLMPVFEAGICLTSSTLRVDYDAVPQDFTQGGPGGAGSTVPEPATFLLLGLGLATTGSIRYFRKK